MLTSGYVLFGEDTEGDVLKNLTARAVSHLVPVGLAHSLVYGIAVAFSFNLLVNFVLKVGWPGLGRACQGLWFAWLALVAAAGAHGLLHALSSRAHL